MSLWWIFAAAAGVSFGLTGLIRRYALWRGVIDVPNERSSHAAPTPRGGGMSIVVTFVVFLILFYVQNRASLELVVALAGAGSWVALVGFADDHAHIPAAWRLVAHCVGAAWVIYWLGTTDSALFALPVWIEAVVVGLYVVGFVNVYNFMDGIDGIAAVEAITVSLGSALMYAASMPSPEWMPPVLLLFATLGFLFWNFPRARIFMGDGCSGFLGISFSVMSIQAWSVDPKFFWGWLVLLGVFLVDTSVTLLRRLLRHERLHVAHRAHAYQYASRRFGSHAKVSSAVAAINIVWLCPIAVAIAADLIRGPLGLVVAYAPLLALAVVFKAGAPEVQDSHA